MRVCGVPGCENEIRPTGVSGRPRVRCEEHATSCVVPGCTGYADRPTCAKHRKAKTASKNWNEQTIERAIRVLRASGYTVTKW